MHTDGVLWYILILEEYSLKIEYIPREKNIVADALSRLHNNTNQILHMSQHIQLKLCRNSMTSMNCQMERFLYHLIS